MKRLALTVTVTLGLLASSASATPKITCHWTHHRSHGVNIYVQVCSVAKQPKHRVNPKWTHAGPGNSPAPRIG